jgi:hypothetical protein
VNWLLRNILADHIRLSPQQLQAVRHRARELAASEPLARLFQVLPGMLPLLAVPFWPKLRTVMPFGLYIVLELAFAACVLGLVAWLMRRAYARYAYRAVRELGFADICPRCGYDWTGLATDIARCPECGRLREPFSSARRE